MTTPAPANIGASRLLGTNNLQQAVDSLETQVNKLATSISNAASSLNNLSGSTNRSSGGSRTGNSWNSNSNRNNYSSNGGGGNFTRNGPLGGNGGNRVTNGGGGSFGMSGGSAAGGAKFAGGVAVAAGIAAGLTNYGNKNMSDNMQRDMFNAYSNVAGGNANSMTARHMVFDNNNLALSTEDAAAAAYTNAYTFGNATFNGKANPKFAAGFAQVQGFGYASPTLGANAAAQAAQQTYSARSAAMSQVLGLQSSIGAGGVKNTMGSIAQSIYKRTFGSNNPITQQQFNAATSQGGSLAVNLQYMGQQMGWNQTTIQEYQNYLTGMNAAQTHGMSSTTYDQLSQQASQGNKTAINKLASTTGLGSSMFETQRNLNATRNTRANDILDTLAPAFKDATNVVNDFSSALTNLLKSTGLDKAIGTGAGWGSALSGGLGGAASGFGMMGGMMGAARLFGMRGGGLGGLAGMFGRGGASAAGGAGGLINGVRGASGAFNITSLGNAAGGASLLARGGPYGLAAAAAGGAAWLGWNSANNDTGAGFGDMLKYSAVINPVGGIALGGSWARRAWDKWGTGKNQESFAHFLNPFGKEQRRTTNTDGRAGGGPQTSGGGGSGTPVGSGSSNSGASAAQVIQFAETQLGVPYVWGGEQPGKGMDCSGLMQWAYGQAGVKIPRVAEDQQNAGTQIPVNQAQPGDLLFNGNPAHHVVMAIGGGKVIEAPRTGLNVRIRGYNPSEFDSATRIVGSVGNMNDLLNGNSSGDKGTLNTSQSRSGGNVGSYAGTSEAEAILSALSGSTGSMSIRAGSKTAGSTSGSGPVGSDPGTGNGGNDKASLQAYAKTLLGKYGWGNQWNDFDALVMSESSWDPKARNASSGAYGLPQALPAGKMASAGSDWQTSGDTQLRWMMDYVKDRYGSPSKAWSFHQKNNWYDAGAWDIDKDQKAVVHQGEMIIPAKQAETIRQAIMNNTFNPNSKGGAGQGIVIGQISVNLPAGYSGSQQEAQATGKMIADTIVNDTRIKNLQRGQ